MQNTIHFVLQAKGGIGKTFDYDPRGIPELLK
jgi:hypothetical protein